MATTKIWPAKDSLARVVDYAQNPEKTTYLDLRNVLHYAANEEKTVERTERAMFVTGVNCNRDTALSSSCVWRSAPFSLAGQTAP